MLLSLNVREQLIRPESRLREDLGLTQDALERFYHMFESCFQIDTKTNAIDKLDDIKIFN